MGIIYKVTAPTGEIYIGKTTGTLERRWNNHVTSASAGSTQPFHKKLVELGFDSFVREVLEVVDDDNDLLRLENVHIEAHRDNGLSVLNIQTNRLCQIDFDLPQYIRPVVEDGGDEILGFRVAVPNKKAYSFRQAEMSLQEKYDLAIAKRAEVLAGEDDPTENRKKKTVVGGSLPQYVYCTEGARTTVRVIVPEYNVKTFSSNVKTKEELIAAALAYRDRIMAGEIEKKPQAAKPPRALPEYIHWSESKQQASFRHPSPSDGMMKQYSIQDVDWSKDALIAEAIRIKDDILSGAMPERPKAGKKTLPTHITWRDDLHVATFRDPQAKKTYNFGFKESPESKEDLVEKALAKKLEVMGI